MRKIIYLIVILFSFVYSYSQIQYELEASPGIVYRSLGRALKFVGVKERGNNRGIEIAKFQESVHLKSGSPWCGAFVYYCFWIESTPQEPVPILKSGSSQAIWFDAVKRGMKVPFNPMAGSLAVWRNIGNDKSGHISRVLKYLGNGWILTVGGNESNQVRIGKKNVKCLQGRLQFRGCVSFKPKKEWIKK